ncbi:MarR family winged helix-turn-helix transcriptional regulator [Alkalicoccobacillus murimartini]|nr:MarR family transcriptional regulator [Alkalicoccobacillus murimartini]
MVNDDIRVLLDKISSQNRRNYNQLLTNLNLHVGQDNLLCKLWNKDGMTQVELCNQLNCEAPTVTNMVKSLEKKGLIIRHKDVQDKRITRIYLTDAGKEIEKPVSEIWKKQQERLLTEITQDEKLLFRRLLKQMEKNLF